MTELEGIHDLRLIISRVPELLIAVLETTIGSWLEYGSSLGATNIQLAVIDDYQKLDEPYRGSRPFLCLYPERSSIKPSINGFHEVTLLFDRNHYDQLTTDYKKLVVMNKLKSLINGQIFMTKETEKYEAVYGLIVPTLQPEERLMKTFILEFSDSYEKSFLSISLGKQPTRNRWD